MSIEEYRKVSYLSRYDQCEVMEFLFNRMLNKLTLAEQKFIKTFNVCHYCGGFPRFSSHDLDYIRRIELGEIEEVFTDIPNELLKIEPEENTKKGGGIWGT